MANIWSNYVNQEYSTALCLSLVPTAPFRKHPLEEQLKWGPVLSNSCSSNLAFTQRKKILQNTKCHYGSLVGLS